MINLAKKKPTSSTELEFVNLLRSPGIDSMESIPLAWAGFFKHSMGARNRLVIGFSYQPARLDRLAEFITLNQFLGSL
jgi:hypothetical protein